MDGLGPALFGLFLVSFTISKPVTLTLSSSESSESNDSSSSEEITAPRTTAQPIVLNTMRPDSLEDDLHHTSAHTAHPGLVQTTPRPANTEQKVVELDLDTSLGPLQPDALVTAVPDLVAPDAAPTTELRCYTVALTSPEPKPARGDNV